MSNQYTDRFSEASEELEEKAAYICKNCNKQYSAETAKENNQSCCGRTLTELLEESFGP